jgi:hypothetical protein
MAGNLSDIINITITRETQSVSQASFSTILILGVNSTLTERYKLYSTSDLAAFAAELSGGVNDPEYKAATTIAAQNPRLSTFAVGRRDAADASYTETLNAVVTESNDFYGIVLADENMGTARIVFDDDFVTANVIDGEINGTAIAQVPFNTSQAQTAADLAVAIAALSDVNTAVVDGADVTDRTILITGAANTAIRPENFLVTLGASQAVASYTGAFEDRKDISTWTEANKKFFATQTSEDDAINKTDALDSDSLMAVLKASSRERTIVFYHTGANHTEFIGAGFLGMGLPFVNDNTAGRWNSAYQQLGNITVDSLTVSQRTNVLAKNGNTYEARGNSNITRLGKVSQGEKANIIIGADWLEAKITELVFALLVNENNVPYTDPGISQVESKLQEAFGIAQTNGFISPDDFDPDTKIRTGGFTTSVPLSRNVPSVDKANQTLNNVSGTGFLSGSIDKTNMSVVLTY